MEYKDMPEPLPLRKVLGPSVILAGVGVGSGEYILSGFRLGMLGFAVLFYGFFAGWYVIVQLGEIF